LGGSKELRQCSGDCIFWNKDELDLNKSSLKVTTSLQNPHLWACFKKYSRVMHCIMLLFVLLSCDILTSCDEMLWLHINLLHTALYCYYKNERSTFPANSWSAVITCTLTCFIPCLPLWWIDAINLGKILGEGLEVEQARADPAIGGPDGRLPLRAWLCTIWSGFAFTI